MGKALRTSFFNDQERSRVNVKVDVRGSTFTNTFKRDLYQTVPLSCCRKIYVRE